MKSALLVAAAVLIPSAVLLCNKIPPHHSHG